MSEKTFRAFIAIDLPTDKKEDIAAAINSLKEQNKKTHWIPMEKLHITLKFLGNISQTQADDIISHLKTIAQNFEPFDIELNKLSLLPSETTPQVITLSASPITPLASLAIEIDHAMLNCGIKTDEKEFKPHLTIGQIKTKKFIEPKLKEKLHIKFKTTEITLFESELNQHPSTYIPIRALHLGKIK